MVIILIPFIQMNTRLPKKMEITLTGKVEKIIANKIGLSPATYYKSRKRLSKNRLN